MVLSSQNKTPKKRGGGAEKARARKAQVLPAPRLTWRRQKGPPPAWLGPRSSAMNLPRPELEVAPREGGGGGAPWRALQRGPPLPPPRPLSFPLRRPEEGSAVPLPRGFCQSGEGEGEGRELRGSGCRRRRRRGVFTGRSRTDTSSQAPPPPPAREGAGRASSRAGDLG